MRSTLSARWNRRAFRTIAATGATVLLSICCLAAIVTDYPNASWLCTGTALSAAFALWAAWTQDRRQKQAEGWAAQLADRDPEPIQSGQNDEFTRMAEQLRSVQKSLRQQDQIAMVKQLSEAVTGKNDQLENAIADLQSAQDRMIGNQKLAELGQMAAGVAHELRNPLHFIRNFAESSAEIAEDLSEIMTGTSGSADNETAQTLNESIIGNMDRINTHVERADRIIHDMLAMGRDTEGPPTEFDVNVMVHKSAMLAYHSSRSGSQLAGLTISERLDDDAGNIHGREPDLSRVIINVVTNACQAALDKDRWQDHAPPEDWSPKVRIATERGEKAVIITVADNGPGMTQETSQQIFRPFFSTKGQDGTGLGLSLSHEIVRAHGGEISVDTEPGAGAVFSIRLPTTTTNPVNEPDE